MPDLFIVMNNDELEEAISFAREQGVTKAQIFGNVEYSLIFNGENAVEYCKDGSWFPPLTDYIVLPTSNGDKIAILLSPTIWINFNMELVYEELRAHGIEYEEIGSSWYDSQQVDKFKEQERQASIESPIESPWTARDSYVLETAIDDNAGIEDIESATLIVGANVKINIYQSYMAGGPIAYAALIEEFSYPNVIHLETKNGVCNVFLGKGINEREVHTLLQKKDYGLSTINYNIGVAELLLYPSRDRVQNFEGRKIS